MNIHLCKNDLPFPINTKAVALDTETMGLNPHRDRLCVVQLNGGGPDTYLIQIEKSIEPAPLLISLLKDPEVVKIFHYARFDMAVLYTAFGVMPQPVYCTKIASKLARTYTDRHGLKELCRDLLSTDLSKFEQSSDWGKSFLTEEQKRYAARDVAYLHQLKDKLSQMLVRENRDKLLTAACHFLSTRVMLDLKGWEGDIFAHGHTS